MSKVGELSVLITADSTQLKKGIKGAQLQIKKTSKELRKSVNQFGKWAAAASVAAAAVGVALVKTNMAAIRETKNLADAANMNVAAFEQNAFAAEQAGVSTEKYGDILKDVNDRIGDFVTSGAGAMVDFFEQIAPKVGVTIDQFQKLSGQDALQLYVSSIEKANVSQAEMTFFMEAIAGDASRLIPLLKDGGKAMKTQAERARELGIGLSQIDVAQVEAANKALDASAGLIDAQLKKAVVAVAPYITTISTELAIAGAESVEWEKAVTKAMRVAAKVVGVFADGILGIRLIVKGLEIAFRGLSAVIYSAFASGIDLLAEFGNKIKVLLEKSIKPVAEAMNKVGLISDDSLSKINDMVSARFKTPQWIKDFEESTSDAFKTAKKEFVDLATQPLPSARIKALFEEIIKKANQAKKEIASTVSTESITKAAADITDFIDGFESSTISAGNILKDAIEGIDLPTSKVDAFYAVMEEGAAKTQLQIRDALSAKGMTTAEIDRYFAFIEQRAKTSGTELNTAMKGGMNTNTIETFFDLLKTKKTEFGSFMSDMFAGQELSTNQIEAFYQQALEKSQEKAAQIKKNLTGMGIDDPIIDEFLASYVAKTGEVAAQIKANLTGGMQADGKETKEEDDESLGVKGFGSEALFEAMATETAWIAQKHEDEIALLEQAKARELNIGQSFEEAKTEMTQRHARERAAAVEAEMNARFAISKDTLSGLNNLAMAMGKKGIKIQKAISLANAGMAIATGLAKAQELGFPMAIGEYARVAAIGVKAISSIKSAAAGSAKIGRSSGGGATSLSRPYSPVSNNQEPSQSRSISINMEGSALFSADQVRELIEQINEQVGDGVALSAGG